MTTATREAARNGPSVPFWPQVTAATLMSPRPPLRRSANCKRGHRLSGGHDQQLRAVALKLRKVTASSWSRQERSTGSGRDAIECGRFQVQQTGTP